MRLRQGDFAAETVYDDDPVAVARAFAAAGARVDPRRRPRRGAHRRAGEPRRDRGDRGAPSPCRVQAGGGVRSAGRGRRAARVRGRRASSSAPPRSSARRSSTSCAQLHPGAIAVGLDARGREVAVRGWVEGSGRRPRRARRPLRGRRASRPSSSPRSAATARWRAPTLDQLRSVLEATALPVIASGGVGALERPARRLPTCESGGRRLAGAIVGRAIYEGRFTVAEALAAVRP